MLIADIVAIMGQELPPIIGLGLLGLLCPLPIMCSIKLDFPYPQKSDA
jgi:hypothetical protein